MKNLVQINSVINSGSTGRIVEEIGQLAIKNNYESYIVYGRSGNNDSKSKLIRSSSTIDNYIHGFQSRILDNHGISSLNSTKKFIEKIKTIKPDLIHLHNIHGYYINYPILFNYLKDWGGPVVWTLHDCWPFTGHCAHYTYCGCSKWENGCFNCPQKSIYPKSLFFDRSKKNYNDKKNAFLDCPNLHIVTVSNWLSKEVGKSFLKDYNRSTIYNGIDLNIFKPSVKSNLYNNEKKILGVASIWNERKGLNDFIELRKYLPDDYKITLIGMTQKQIKELPLGITGYEKTTNIQELVSHYNSANVYVNTSKEETLGMTTIEALACGTPAVVCDSTAVAEPINHKTGFIINPGNIKGMAEKIIETCEMKPFSSTDCRERVELLFDKNKNYKAYIELYNNLVGKN